MDESSIDSPLLTGLQLLRLIEQEGSYRGTAQMLGFAHRALRYDHQYAKIFRSVMAPLIDHLRVAQFSSMPTVTNCHQVHQLNLYKQDLGLIPFSMGETG